MTRRVSMAKVRNQYPEPKIKPTDRRSASWWFWRRSFDNMSEEQKNLFEEIANVDPIAVEMVFKFFCLDGQAPTNREAIADWHNCSGATVYGKIGAVLATLFPRVVKRRGYWIDDELLRLQRALAENRERKELEEIGREFVQSLSLKIRIPKRCWRERLPSQLSVVSEAQKRGVFEKLKELDESAYWALSFRFGLVDGEFHTEKETAIWLAELKITESSRVGTANKVLLRGIAILAGEVYGQVSPQSIRQIRKYNEKRKRRR